MASANEKLIKNLENQLERLVEQLKDLDDSKDDLPPEEFELIRVETKEQIKEFGETLDRMQKGNTSLENKLSLMKKAIRDAIANSFNTVEMIKLFGDQNANELEKQLLKLDEEYHLKKIVLNEFERRKADLLNQILTEGHSISANDKIFLQNYQSDQKDFERLERIDDEINS